MNRDLSTLGLAPSVLQKLIQAGFKTVIDFKGIKPAELSKELDVSHEEALSILTSINKPEERRVERVTALDLLEKEPSQGHVMTFNSDLDDLLGGGVKIGQVTEFCGVPGIGKTQLGMQLAAAACIPEHYDGLSAKVIYLDTEGSFVVERMLEVAEATVEHIKRIAETPEDLKVAEEFTVQKVLSSIQYYRVHDFVEQVALINILPMLMEQQPGTKLVILDSVAFHFRHFDDFKSRSRLLNNMSQTLNNLARECQVAVVLINQMTTNVKNGETTLVAALGETWSHAATNRILLSWEDGFRCATLQKSPYRPFGSVKYSVTQAGIR